MERALPLVGVVVIGRNEGERLVRCLDSVLAMDPPPGRFELVYVDSNSTDGSVAVARDRGAKVVQMPAGRQTAARARNAGWRATAAPLVLFLDGDTLLDPRFLNAALVEIENPQVAVVWGHRRELRPGDSIYNRVLDLDWIYPPGPAEFCGGDALMRRADLEEVGGFDEGLIAGEEPELCRRLRERGQAISHIDQPMTLHDLAIRSFGQYWLRAYRAGHAYAEVAARYRNSPMPLWQREVRQNTIHGLFLLFLPLTAIGAAVLWRSPVPFLAAVAFALLLVLRSAWRCRWKSADPWTCLAYACHSQFQKIPILFGQAKFWRNRRRGRREQLIEYKDPR